LIIGGHPHTRHVGYGTPIVAAATAMSKSTSDIDYTKDAVTMSYDIDTSPRRRSKG
jgi:hypothetical protein